MNLNKFFSICVFFHEHSPFTGQQGKGEGISITSLDKFHSLRRHFEISRAITIESSPLHIASSRTQTGKPLLSERKSLTSKQRAYYIVFVNVKVRYIFKCITTFQAQRHASLQRFLILTNRNNTIPPAKL